MRVAIAGAGAVGRSIAAELTEASYDVILIERYSGSFEPESVERADWILGDACEVSTLEESGVDDCDVVIAATGDDKVNLVVSLLAKEEFGVQRVVARVNAPANEWLFTEQWGVDAAVSTPRMLAAMVEEATGLGELVRLMTFRQGQAALVETTLPEHAAVTGKSVRDLALPDGATLVAILRGPTAIAPQPDDRLAAGDELLFVARAETEPQLREALA
ncbi:MAG: TrkA family potassium uptake protein [Actinophytocola sp.]|nr:TrkA family potassium uptake protein [Actinophytocola sp.]